MKLLFPLSIALALAACGDAATESPRRDVTRRPVVAVTSGPAALIATLAVGPERVDVVPATADWRPSDDDLDRLLSAERVLLVGLDHEPWAQRAGLAPGRTLELGDFVDASRVIETAVIEHTHGGGAAHTHGGTVHEAWSDPELLNAMVHGAAEALAGVLPEVEGAGAAAVERRAAFTERVSHYADLLREIGAALGERKLIAARDGLQYIARAGQFPLEVIELTTDDGRPNDHELAKLESVAKGPAYAPLVVWPHGRDAALAERIEAQLGLPSLDFDLGAEARANTLDRLIDSATRLLDALPD